MADKTVKQTVSRVTTKAHRSDSNRHECLEANYALSGLYAEDVGRQY